LEELATVNYLFHLYLAEDSQESLVGNMLGDFVKGRLDERYPPAITRGIERHRQVDAFAQDNAAFQRSKRRIDDSYRHYKAVLVDVFYDHFLARQWASYSPLPLPEFSQRAYQALQAHYPLLPERLQQMLPRMIAVDWLTSYRELPNIGIALERMATRLSRPNPLGRGVEELVRHYAGLEGDFREFMVEVEAYLRG
jgi:acyl carrier protein phosphodiesterase